MILRRLLFSSVISTFYLAMAQSITCQNCTTSNVCNPTSDVCTSPTCFIVSNGEYMTNGCAITVPNYSFNGSLVNGLCFWSDNTTRICACRTSSCNNLLDSSKYPIIDTNPLPSIDIQAMLALAEQSPATMAPTEPTSIAPEATTLSSNSLNLHFIYLFLCLISFLRS